MLVSEGKATVSNEGEGVGECSRGLGKATGERAGEIVGGPGFNEIGEGSESSLPLANSVEATVIETSLEVPDAAEIGAGPLTKDVFLDLAGDGVLFRLERGRPQTRVEWVRSPHRIP